MKINNFVIFPREIKSDYLNGKITKNEFLVYVWLRLSANPYSICTISLTDIKNDVFKGKGSENYVNKLLLSLKRKRYVYYSNRKGRRGSFEVHIGDFLLASGKISNLDHLFKQKKVRGSDATTPTTKSEDITEVETQSQSLKKQKQSEIISDSPPDDNRRVRGDNNDNKNDIENIDKGSNLYNSSFRNDKKCKPAPINNFIPDNNSEYKCWEMAKWLGEADMQFILSIKRKGGLEVIQRAVGIIKEIAEQDPNKIKDKRKYFNKLVKNLMEKNGY